MRTAEQPRAALVLANEARMARVALKRALGAGEKTFRDAIEDSVAQKMTVWVLLKALPGVGPQRIMDISSALARRGVLLSSQARIKGLTERQKLALLDVVESRGSSKPKAVKAKPTPKRERRLPSPAVVAAREAALVAVENPPPRCTSCKAQLLAESASGLCGFCLAEAEEAAA